MHFTDTDIDDVSVTTTIFNPMPPGPGYTPPLGSLVCKRGMDLALSTLLILGVLSWALPILALLIRVNSRGPLFFLQQRRGKAGTFTCIKLRTMVVNTEADTRIATMGDERITRVGRWLRRTHLDEIPQLFNVWKGDMSLVGPRPYMVHEDQFYGQTLPTYGIRNHMKPGMTGLAQSRGYFGATGDLVALEKRLSLDIHYIRNWSLIMDLRILISTLPFLSPFPREKPYPDGA
jgi:putative colanic acid biosysnthesis UDP-glucose lipid carrier transferase